jgi:hypothetical protein
MSEEKSKGFVTGFNVKRSLVTVLLVLVTGVAVGGAMWFVMDRNANNAEKESKRSMEKLEATISELKEKDSSTESSAKKTSSTTDASITEVETFCQGLHPTSAIGNVRIMETANGLYANCSVTEPGSDTGGGFLIAKKITGTWTMLWEGNGTISNALCDTHKIPSTMSGGVCQY